MLIYRSSSNLWEGPFKFIHFEVETVIVETAQGRKIFRSNCFKLLTKRNTIELVITDDHVSKIVHGATNAVYKDAAGTTYAIVNGISGKESGNPTSSGDIMIPLK